MRLHNKNRYESSLVLHVSRCCNSKIQIASRALSFKLRTCVTLTPAHREAISHSKCPSIVRPSSQENERYQKVQQPAGPLRGSRRTRACAKAIDDRECAQFAWSIPRLCECDHFRGRSRAARSSGCTRTDTDRRRLVDRSHDRTQRSNHLRRCIAQTPGSARVVAALVVRLSEATGDR